MRRHALAILAVTTCVASQAWAGPTVCASGTTTPGIDVSKWQGAIDFGQVANTQAFVIARVSDGTYLDTWFDSYWPDIKAAGMVRGAYQYFEPAEDPIAQADILLSKMGPMEPGMLPPTLDVEATGGLTPAEVEAAVQQWVDYVQAQLGVAPMVYTGNWFWDPSVNSSAQAGLPLWESYYCTNCCPKIPLPWSDWAIWQYDDKGSVAGVSGDCDMNLWNGDLASLQAFAGGGGSSGPVCGDGICEGSETKANCAADCGSPTPGANVCDAGCDGPTPAGATINCYCDNLCQNYGDCCNADGSATGTSCAGSTCASCNGVTTGPVCGDGTCDNTETCSGCPSDCGACTSVCGDGNCDTSETCSTCATDCGACAPKCGDGNCDSGETCSNCKADCGKCPADVVSSDINYVDAGCNSNGQCPNVCNQATGMCVQCNVAADCFGQQCNNHVCVTVCGDGQCAGDESNQNCCVDCPCAGSNKCVGGLCTGGGTCSDSCAKLYGSECASATSYHVCQKASGGCLAWDPDKSCSSGLVCYQGKCMSPSSVPDVQESPDISSEDTGGSVDSASSQDSASSKDSGVSSDAKDAKSSEVLTDAGSSSSDGKVLFGDASKSDVKFFGGGGGGGASGCSARPGHGGETGFLGWLLLCGVCFGVRLRRSRP
jgi:GH25 family lysozyme M1 (1,4-beta-N-acetylmuramidase)